MRDGWAAGATYEDFMGRWSRRLAPEFVSWLRMPGGVHWLDVGCGTGAMVNAICARAEPASVLGCDPSTPFIEYAIEHSEDDRASFVVAGAGSLPGRGDGYGSVTSLFALNFFPDPATAVEEMRVVAAPGGTVSACVWDYSGRMEFLRHFWDVVVAMDPTARELDEGVRFPICRFEALERLYNGAGLADVSCQAIEIPTVFAGFDDYWKPLLAGTGPAAAYVSALNADRREELARDLEQDLPRGRDGTIVFSARAWAVRGIAG